MLYSEYCEATGQRRLTTGTEVSKQMYKLHKPHLDSGYLAKVEFEKMLDAAGQPDWNIWYMPGSRARDEYVKFSAGKESSNAMVGNNGRMLPLGQTPGEELATHFLQLRFGQVKRRIAPKERVVAEALLQDHALDEAKTILAAALRSATEAGAKPRWMTELQSYIEEAQYPRQPEQERKPTDGNT